MVPETIIDEVIATDTLTGYANPLMSLIGYTHGKCRTYHGRAWQRRFARLNKYLNDYNPPEPVISISYLKWCHLTPIDHTLTFILESGSTPRRKSTASKRRTTSIISETRPQTPNPLDPMTSSFNPSWGLAVLVWRSLFHKLLSEDNTLTL